MTQYRLNMMQVRPARAGAVSQRDTVEQSRQACTSLPGNEMRGALAGEALYEQLRAYTLSATPHQAIASERRLAATYGMSPSTVRRVLDRLSREGLVYRVRGKGSFVGDRGRNGPGALREIVYADTWGDVEHAYYVRRLHGMIHQAQSSGLRLLVQKCPQKDIAHAEGLFEEIRREQVKGLILGWLGAELFERIRAADRAIKIVTTANPVDEPDTASVRPDYVAFGRQAAGRLLRDGARRIALVRLFPETLAGVSARVPGPEGTVGLEDIADAHVQPPEAICARLRAIRPDGVIFDEDRTASRVLANLQREDGRFLRKTRVISQANVGENLLPPTVGRYVCDGFEVGRLAVRLLRDMVDHALFLNTDVRVRGTWIPPAA